MLNLIKSFQDKIIVSLAIALIAFGTFNLSVSVFAAQNATKIDTENGDMIDPLFEAALAQALPIMGGIITLGFQYARQHGLKVSAEAEEYFVNSAKSFVANQSRFLYNEIKSNPEYKYALSQGIVPKELGKKAKTNVIEQLRTELRSDEFTGTARKMLDDNLPTLVERFVTEENKELVEKTTKMFRDLIPVATDAVLLSYQTPEKAKEDKDRIIKEILDSVNKNFDYEDMLFSDDIAIMHIKSELNKRLGVIKINEDKK